MTRTLRWAQWSVVATAVLLLFWVAATLGGWSPELRRLATNVHGPLVADYRAESPQRLAPLSPDITSDASRDQAGSPPAGATPSPVPTSSGAQPSPTGSGTPAPSPSMPIPSLPSLPVVTPKLPSATPTPLPTPSLPTLPPLP